MAQIKRFNWVQRPTAWEYAQAWRQHRSRMTQRFLNEGADASNAFLTAQINLSTGMAALAAQASIQRAQNEIKTAQNQFSAVKNQINLLA